MAPNRTPEDVAFSMLDQMAMKLTSVHLIQPLWAGYGQICRLTAEPQPLDGTMSGAKSKAEAEENVHAKAQEPQPYILKLIAPPPAEPGDEGHIRKILSYQVEQYFYTHLAHMLPPSVHVAKCLASINDEQQDGSSTTAMILSDLSRDFPVAGEKRGVLSETQVHAALDWLSSFHGFWWPRVKDFSNEALVRPPLDQAARDADRRMRGGRHAPKSTVWLNGGYTYLATRRSEFASLEAADCDSEWRRVLTTQQGQSSCLAEEVASILSPSENGQGPADKYMTLLHGDVKTENLFTSADGASVAFYDFQYVGLGLGVCDLAKYFTCSVPLDMLVGKAAICTHLPMQDPERKLLQRYLQRLVESSGKEYEWDVFVGHWEVALIDWLRFQASWGFWGHTEWLEARVRWIVGQSEKQ